MHIAQHAFRSVSPVPRTDPYSTSPPFPSFFSPRQRAYRDNDNPRKELAFIRRQTQKEDQYIKHDSIASPSTGLYGYQDILRKTPTTATTNTDSTTQTALCPPSAHTKVQARWALVAAECSSCHTTSTPLGRNHKEKTVCDICGIYSKFYAKGNLRPMKSDVVRMVSQSRSDDVPPPVSHHPSSAPDTSPTPAPPDPTTLISYEFGEGSITTSSEFVGARGLTNMNAIPIVPYYNRSRTDPLSNSMEHDPIMNPRSSKGRMSKDCDTIHRGLPLHTLVTNLEGAGSQPQPDVDNNSLSMAPLHPRPASKSTSHNPLLQPSESLDLGSMSPSSHPQPQSESNSVRPPDGEPPSINSDLNSQLKEHAGLELALTAVLATVSFSIVCSDGREAHPQVCLALGVLRPISLLLHLGAALTTCAISFIPQNGGNGVSSRCLRLFWIILFGLALISIIVQVSLSTWTVGNLATSAITVLLAIFCSLPGFYLISLKWYRVLQRRGVER